MDYERIDRMERHPTRSTPEWFREPTLGARLGGSIIDSLVLLPLASIYLIADGVAVQVLLVVVHAVYEIVLTTQRGQTLGKMAMGTRVVDATDGGLIGPQRAVVRWFALNGIMQVAAFDERAFLVAGIYNFVVCMMVLRGPFHEGLHDRIAGTMVTRVDRDEPASAT